MCADTYLYSARCPVPLLGATYSCLMSHVLHFTYPPTYLLYFLSFTCFAYLLLLACLLVRGEAWDDGDARDTRKRLAGRNQTAIWEKIDQPKALMLRLPKKDLPTLFVGNVRARTQPTRTNSPDDSLPHIRSDQIKI